MAREMKESGIEWIGEIPKDWKIERNKNAFSCSKEIVGSQSSETQLLSLTTRGVKQKGQDVLGGKLPETFDTYQCVEKDDLIMCLFDLDCSAVFSGISPYSGMISPAYKVLKCKDCIVPTFADYWFSFVFVDRKFKTYAKNLRYTLTYEEFSTLPVITPPLEEQQAIADFLDKKCAEIDSVIEQTKATIEEYKKLKQSVITEAVTKGIRGARPMKDSGIEWIGDIPSEWKAVRFKNAIQSLSKGSGITKEEIVENGDTPCVRYGEIYTKYNYSFNECSTRTNKDIIQPRKYFYYGDILVVCTGELVEEIGKSIVYLGNEECLAGGDIIVVSHSQNPSFLNYAFNSTYAQAQKSCSKSKLKVVHISASDISNVLIALPTLEEQEEIANYLDQKCLEIDTLIEKKTQLLEEMETLKKSIIFEYVTGKKEVL